MSKRNDVPYRNNLPENLIPKQWLNIRAFMKKKAIICWMLNIARCCVRN